MGYEVRTFVHESGERMSVVVDTENSLPMTYLTLYSTIHHRNYGDAFNTIKSKLDAIKYLFEVCDYLDIDLEERFSRGDWLKCSGQLKLATVLEFSQYKRSDSLGVNPPLF